MAKWLPILIVAALFAAALLFGISGHARAAARLDRRPVSAADLAGAQNKNGSEKKSESPSANEPAVLIDWYRAREYCAAQKKRLPSATEWNAACEAGELEFPWGIWEWTTTEAGGSESGFKLLCGPGGSTCGCTHAYDPSWSNEVKGFRCAKSLPSVRLLEKQERR